MKRAVSLVCEACGYVAAPLRTVPTPFVCPAAGSDGADHLLAPHIVAELCRWPNGDEREPFVRYRDLLFGHQAALELGLGDEGYLALVSALDSAVASVDGHGFRATPLVRAASSNVSSSWSVRKGITGAILMPTGIPASVNRLMVCRRRTGAVARGSRYRETW